MRTMAEFVQRHGIVLVWEPAIMNPEFCGEPEANEAQHFKVWLVRGGVCMETCYSADPPLWGAPTAEEVLLCKAVRAAVYEHARGDQEEWAAALGHDPGHPGTGRRFWIDARDAARLRGLLGNAVYGELLREMGPFWDGGLGDGPIQPGGTILQEGDQQEERMRIGRARIIPTVGTPGTIDADEALAVFWTDYQLWQKLSQIDGNDDLRPPKIEVYGPEGVAFRVDGAAAPRKCDACGWPMLRDESLDEPILGLGGTWRGSRCSANPTHTGLEPFD